MNWIDLKEQKPDRDQKVLVYCHRQSGLHREGIYIAWYVKFHESEEFLFLIDDKTGESNNYKNLVFFSHWMPLPLLPCETK
jgi:hypothetical protein